MPTTAHRPATHRPAAGFLLLFILAGSLLFAQEPPRGFLGISLEPVSAAMRVALALEEGRGVLVRRVVPGSAAEEAGLAEGDVILELEGRPMRGPRELSRAVGALGPGDSLDMKVWRGGQQLSLQAFLMARPEGTNSARPQPRADLGRLGLVLAPLTDQLSRYFDAPGGALVTRVEPGSAGEIAGLAAGDVIVAAGEVEILSGRHLHQVLTSWDELAVLLAVVRNGNDIYLRVSLE
jgi:serine protease Do